MGNRCGIDYEPDLPPLTIIRGDMKKYIFLGVVWMTLNLSPFVNKTSLADSFEDDSCSSGATSPQLAFDARGNAVAVWFEVDGKNSVWARRYDLASGWGAAYRVSSEKSKISGPPVVAVDADGSAMAAWDEWKGKSTVLRVNRYSLEKGWGKPAAISRTETANDGKVFYYGFVNKIIADNNGNCFILWGKSAVTEQESEMDSHKYMGVIGTSIYINRFDAGQGGWGEPINADKTGKVIPLDIKIDGKGNAYAMWQRTDIGKNSGEKVHVEINRYEVGKGWSTPAAMEIPYFQTTDYIRPHIAVDSQGNVMATWQQSGSIYAKRYDRKSGTWGGDQVIESGTYIGPEVAMNENGDLFAAWNAMEGQNNSKIWAKRYVAGKGWEVAKLINDANAASDQMQIAVDPRGDAIIVWRQYGGSSYNIWANRYDVDKGWGEAVLIDADNINEARDPKIDVDGNGNAIVVWSKCDGKLNNIYANGYLVGKGWQSPTMLNRNGAGKPPNQ